MKTNFQKLIFSSFLATLFVAARFIFTGEHPYLFLIWNLFLAWLPFLLSDFLVKKKTMRITFILPLLALWMLFFPNAPYILTDLMHLKNSNWTDMRYDLVMILAFAWIGLMLAIASLRNIQQILKERWGKWVMRLSMPFIFLATGFGVYIGRFDRFNSWDIASDPLGLVQHLLGYFLHPHANEKVWVFTLAFAVFLAMSYISVGEKRVQTAS